MDEQTNVPQESLPEQQSVKAVAEPQDQKVDVSGIDASFPVPGAGQMPVKDEVDEQGVPYKNRFHEYKRKFDETSTQLSEMKEMISSLAQSKQQEKEPELTIEDVEAWKQAHPEHAVWCESKKAELLRKSIVDSVKAEFSQAEQLKQQESIKQQSLQLVAQSFPQAFAKDQNGNITGWDLNNPLTQRIAEYSKDPGIANRPDGLVIASKLAAADMYASGLMQQQKVVNQQKAEIGDLQRRTTIEGSGFATTETPQRVQALNRLRDTGKKSDAQQALRNMFKDAGIIK